MEMSNRDASVSGPEQYVCVYGIKHYFILLNLTTQTGSHYTNTILLYSIDVPVQSQYIPIRDSNPRT